MNNQTFITIMAGKKDLSGVSPAVVAHEISYQLGLAGAYGGKKKGQDAILIVSQTRGTFKDEFNTLSVKGVEEISGISWSEIIRRARNHEEYLDSL